MAKELSPAYRRRIDRNLAKGLSRAAARGHAKHGEKTASGSPSKLDAALADALAHVLSGGSVSQAAKANRVSRERLRGAVSSRGDYVLQGRRYRFIPRQRNNLPLYSAGDSIRVVVDDANAALLGGFMAAVGRFLRTQKLDLLTPFVGGGVTDMQGRFHPFETDPEELYRLDTKGRPVFHQIYQLSNGGGGHGL